MAGMYARHIMQAVMVKSYSRRRKPDLSLHQKQMRFFTRVAVCVAFGFIFCVFWLVNRPGYPTH